MKREYVVIPIISCFMTLALLFALGALPQQFKSARMTDSTLATSIDDEVGNAESAHAEILGIPVDTNINNALFAVTASGLTKVILQDLAGDPAASGELARNATNLKYHDGTSARTAAFLDSTQTLTNKTINAASNTITNIGTSEIATDGVDSAEIAAGAVGTSEIEDGSVATGDLNTATGFQTSTLNTVDITMNEYSFFPNFDYDDCVASHTHMFLRMGPTNTSNDHVGRVSLQGNVAGNCNSGSVDVRWRYVTASRPAEIVVRRELLTHNVTGIWKSEIENEDLVPLRKVDGQQVLNISDFPDRLKTANSRQIFNELRAGTLIIDRVSSLPVPRDNPIRLVAEKKGRKWVKGIPMARMRDR